MIIDNLLGLALTAVGRTPNVMLRRYKGDRENDFGATIACYGDPEPIYDVNVQPVSIAQKNELGLDVNQDYVSVHLSTSTQGIFRGREADILLWGGHKWQIMPANDWFLQNHWVQVLAVKIA